ncbi:MAG: minor capsid protein [Cyanobacteria bacterium REEB417]|nr:minor capsid protein [Cyanobacteria bacterium REEB417]
MPTIGDQQLQLADDYAAALDTLADRATANTQASLRRALTRTLRDLRRYYGQFVDPNLPDQLSADGVTRRPGSYSIADGSAKFRKLIELSQGFLSDRELAWLQNRLREAFNEAVALGGDLGQQLAQTANPDATAQSTFVGASRAAVEAATNTASAYIRGEVESFRDNIVRIVTDGVGRGKGPRVLEGEIRTALEGARDPQGLNNRMGLAQRAELIARSELANAYVGAQKAAAARNGYGYVRWIATKDERTCPVCASRHGRVYRIGEVVAPGHPRCRCGLSPVATEAVEERDPVIRASLLRESYWQKSREDLTREFAAAKGGPDKGWPFARASQVLEEAVRKPSPSERRQYPGIERAPEPVA